MAVTETNSPAEKCNAIPARHRAGILRFWPTVSAHAQLTILAPGLLGGSVARAARARGVPARIVVRARRPEIRLKLREQPWCDAVADTPAEAVHGAMIVVIAAPVDQIVPLLRQIAPHLAPGAMVTDVGSVKGEIARLGHAALAPHAH